MSSLWCPRWWTPMAALGSRQSRLSSRQCERVWLCRRDVVAAQCRFLYRQLPDAPGTAWCCFTAQAGGAVVVAAAAGAEEVNVHSKHNNNNTIIYCYNNILWKNITGIRLVMQGFPPRAKA
jgi:hypothetical protein